MSYIDKGIRLTNYLIDITLICILWICFQICTGYYSYTHFEFYLIMFLYYFIFELTTGQTLGKMLTKTKVVQKNGKKAHFLKILARSILRIIPIDAMSYLLGSEWGLHDLLSSTRLIKTKPKEKKKTE